MLTELGQFKHFNDAAIVFAVGGVEVVFDAVVAAAGQLLGDLGPLVAHGLVQREYLFLFLTADRVLLNVRVQVVMPPAATGKELTHEQRFLPFATLLASAAADAVLFAQALGDESPPLRAELFNQVHNRIVFLQPQKHLLRTIPVTRKHNNFLSTQSNTLTVWVHSLREFSRRRPSPASLLSEALASDS